MNVWPSSGEGRETQFCAPPGLARTHASSPRKAGAPNGRSRRGIAS